MTALLKQLIKKTALLKQLIKTTDAYKKALKDEIEDLCYPIDYANAPFFILEKLGCDVEKMSEHCTINKYDDQNIVSYLEDTIEDLLHNCASDLISELSHKYGYETMSLDEFNMEYKFNEEDTKNILNLLNLFGL